LIVPAGPTSDVGDPQPASVFGPYSVEAAGVDRSGLERRVRVRAASVAADTRGAALAGVVVDPSGTDATYFNRRGGAPTVTHTAPGWYDIAFPGIDAWFIATLPIAAPMSSAAMLVSATTSGGHFMVTTHAPGGASADGWFTFTCFPASATG
jgi:hypothetical protein